MRIFRYSFIVLITVLVFLIVVEPVIANDKNEADIRETIKTQLVNNQNNGEHNVLDMVIDRAPEKIGNIYIKSCLSFLGSLVKGDSNNKDNTLVEKFNLFNYHCFEKSEKRKQV